MYVCSIFGLFYPDLIYLQRFFKVFNPLLIENHSPGTHYKSESWFLSFQPAQLQMDALKVLIYGFFLINIELV